MTRPAKDDDGFEWTIHEDLPAEAPLPPLTGAPARPRRLGWPARALAGLAITLMAAAPWLWTQWEWRGTEAAIAAQLAAEPPTPPVPPVGVLQHTAGATATLRTLTPLGPGQVRADAAYRYRTLTGETVTFLHPFFFEEADGRWRSMPPPADYPGETRTLRRPHLEINYFVHDAALVEGFLAPWLTPLIARACEAWDCLDEAVATVDLISERPPWSERQLLPDEPLLFQLLRAERFGYSTDPWTGAPARAGSPGDEGARELWRRAVGVRALTRLAHNNFSLNWGGALPNSPFFFALVARLAARLEADTDLALTFSQPRDPELEADLLGGDEPVRTIGDAITPEERRAALAMLNRYLAAHPQASEAAMFADLNLFLGLESGALGWLARHSVADGLPLAEFNTRWQAFLAAAHAPPPLPTGAELAVGCVDGPRLVVDGQPLAILPFATSSYLAWPTAGWSPSGRYLALGLGLNANVLDLEAGQLRQAEAAGANALAVPVAWVADTVLAYYALPITVLTRGDALTPEAFELRFHDLADPARVFTPLTGIGFPLDNPLSFKLSPDRALALVSQPDGALALMPALGGARTRLVGDALAADWSDDGQRIVVAHWDKAAQSARVEVIEAASGARRLLWDSAAGGLVFSRREELWARLDWAPGDGPVALAINQAGVLAWAGLVPAAGGPAQVFAEGPATVSALAFSPDGAHLAIGGSPDERGLWLYTVAARALRPLDGGGSAMHLAWAPAGDQLVISGWESPVMVSGVLEPTPVARPLALTGLDCGAGQWRPRP